MQARHYCRQTLSCQLCGTCRQVLLAFAEYLCQHQSTNEHAQRIVENMNVFLLPSANPDGFEAMTRENRCMQAPSASHSAAVTDSLVVRAQDAAGPVSAAFDIHPGDAALEHCLRPLLTFSLVWAVMRQLQFLTCVFVCPAQCNCVCRQSAKLQLHLQCGRGSQSRFP